MFKHTYIFSNLKLNYHFFRFFIGSFLLLLSSCSIFKPHTPVLTEDNRFVLTTDTLLVFPQPLPLPDTIEEKAYVDTALLGFENFLKESNLVNISELDSSIAVELRYATNNNFMHTNMYRGFKKAYLQRDVALRLVNAQRYLQARHPHYRLIVYDAVRPLEIQRFMWDSVKIADAVKYKYLSNPKYHSLHNYGAAVDVSIVDSSGKPLDMGTPYDCFCELAYPYYEKRFLANKKLSHTQYKNRLLLRQIMRKALFSPITTEWWHFNAHSRKYAAVHYPLIKSFSQRPSSILLASNDLPKKSLSVKNKKRNIQTIPHTVSPKPPAKILVEIAQNLDSAKRTEAFRGISQNDSIHQIDFRMQIKLSTKRLALSNPIFKGQKVETYWHKGYYKYTIGHFRSLKTVLSQCNMLRKKGFPGCFVVAFDGNERIPIKDAISLLEE